MQISSGLSPHTHWHLVHCCYLVVVLVISWAAKRSSSLDFLGLLAHQRSAVSHQHRVCSLHPEHYKVFSVRSWHRLPLQSSLSHLPFQKSAPKHSVSSEPSLVAAQRLDLSWAASLPNTHHGVGALASILRLPSWQRSWRQNLFMNQRLLAIRNMTFLVL